MKRVKYPIGIQSFKQLREDGFAYVDKTDLIYQMIEDGRAYFLSRPRRFGKSLLLSTMKSFFEGRKDLFEGLAMERLVAESEQEGGEMRWVKRPVFHLSLASAKHNGPGSLDMLLNLAIRDWEVIYGKDDEENTFSARFKGVIRRAYEQTGQQVAILIDEYDAPLLDVIDQPERVKEVRLTMRDFFSPLKDMGEYTRFLFITGVTKFSSLSIFSELNHLANISMVPSYAAICGLTLQEIKDNFPLGLSKLAEANRKTMEEIHARLKRMYDGYHFCRNSPDIYNPFSLLHVLSFAMFDSYWFASGTPTFLLNVLQENQVNVDELDGAELIADDFNAPIVENVPVIPLFYHSGYLTIKAYDERRGTYTLTFPNEEVRLGLIRSLIPRLMPHVTDGQNLSIFRFVDDLESGDIDMFLTRLRSFFGDVPYVLNNKTEKHFQTIMYIFTRLIGQYVQVEQTKARGRIDMLLRTHGYCYIFEFKFDKSAEEALQQINVKDYALGYELSDDKVVKIGLNFNSETRTIEEWKISC